MTTTQSRPSRAFASYTMPSGSGDMTQQQPIGGAFPAPLSYGSKSIWNHPSAHTRERSIASGAAVGETSDNTSGSNGLNSTAEPTAWAWNNASNQTRSDSTSPNRTRDNGSLSYFEQQAAVGSRSNAFTNGTSIQDESNGHASYLDSVHSVPGQSSRDASLPPSRQSQGSPAFAQDIYRNHNPSNSIHSQRAMHGSSASFSANQSANHRAFNMNRQVDGDIAAQIGNQISRDGSAAGSRSFNPASQPFQRTQGSQGWPMDEHNGAHTQNGALGYTDQMNNVINQFAALKGPGMDRASPVSGYRLEGGNGDYRGFAPRQDVWNSRPSSRDPRTGDFDRRGLPTQAFAPGYQQPYYPNQFQPYLQQQFPANFIDPYSNNFRQSALNSYAMPQIHPGYPLVNGNLPTRPARDQDPGKGMRSAVLEEFRNCNKSNRKYELRDIYGHVVEFSGDQHGSRFIQEKLISANSDEKDQVFLEIEPNAIQLMKDVFGNYVVQKFFEHGSQVQKKMLAEKMKGQVVALSMQVYACRVVQKALEHVLVEQQAELTKELESEVLKVIRDANGNHVVQKIVELVPRQHIDFIMDAMRGNVSTLSAHSYGCRVVQRLLEHGSEEDKAEITKELHASSHLLITDQFGNYVAQHVITHGKPEDSSQFIEVVLKDVLTLSKHKFASNVVESCIEKGSPDQRKRLYETFTSGDEKSGPLPATLKDQYGNYVICKLLNNLETDVQDAFLDQLKAQLDSLKQSGFSRQLQNLEKLVGPMTIARDARLRTNEAGISSATTKETETQNNAEGANGAAAED